MSWLRNHFRHFVLPGIYALAHSRGKPITVADIKPRDKEVRPSNDCKYVEAGMLYAVVSSILRKGDPTREAALGLCRQIGRAKDAEFVYEVDKRGGIKGLGEGYDGVEGSDVLHSMLCNSMRRLKRKMRHKGQLLLPGRDVWCWEVMARKLTVGSTYDPRVSRAVAGNRLAIKTCIDDWKIQNWQDVLFFDTGFSGSIPRAIAGVVGLQSINMALLSSVDPKTQIFRTHTGSRAKALAFEYVAKYFKSGTTRDGKPFQELADLDEFIKAAMLTIWLWHHVSPTRLPSYRDKKLTTEQKFVKNLKINPTFTSKVTLTGGGTGPHFSDTLWPADNTSVSSTSNPFVVDWSTSATTSSSQVSHLQLLDQLWGAGTSGQILVDKAAIAPKFGMAPKKIQPYVLDPNTFEVKDAVTGQNVEDQMDAQTLGVLKGKTAPTEEGFGFGQYPGPPLFKAGDLKQLAGMPVNSPEIPEINMTLETGPPVVPGGLGVMYKKLTFTGPDGTEKVYKTPLTG